MKFISLSILVFSLMQGCGTKPKLDNFEYKDSFNVKENSIQNEFQFNGYTEFWHGTYQKWTRYGNLFKIVTPDVEYSIAQSKLDVAEDMGIPGLSMEEGFFNGLIAEPYISMEQPSIQQLEDSLTGNNVLAFVDANSETGKELTKKYTKNNTPLEEMLESHQSIADGIIEVNAFVLEDGKRKLFVISSTDQKSRSQIKDLLISTEKILNDYDMKRGWFGAKTLLNSVTSTPGHPLEVIGKGMNEGNSWFVFDGYMDFLSKEEIKRWTEEVNLPIITDVGFSPIYGLKNYDSLQVQSMFTPESWVKYAHEKGGYVFRKVYDPQADSSHLPYDGYIATEGNKEQIDNENVPFVSITGNLESGADSCMVLFIKKGEQLTEKRLWESILGRREVAVLDKGKMMGPALYRNALEIMLLDRVFIEEYFGDRVSIEASTKGYQLNITVRNTYSHAVSGKLGIVIPAELKLTGDTTSTLNIPANSTKILTFKILPEASAMNRTNPIAVHYNWGNAEKSTLTMLDLPPAISVYHLLYGHSPMITYPVTIHNFTQSASFPVKVEVLEDNKSAKVIFKSEQTCSTSIGTFKNMTFGLNVPSGNYLVKVTALGLDNISQLGVGKAVGTAHVYKIDLNNDGTSEYRMENDSVQVTLLTIGARVIEYIIKSRNDNILFKLWPEKPNDDRRPFRKREYYPYGGFEDFIGQPSIETHKVYDAEILKKDGDYVQVKMTANYYGNKIEKIFTLYGDSPLLGIQLALTFKNRELNMIGPQPMLVLGNKPRQEDVYTFPEIGGLRHYSMDPDKYYGRILHLTEGWNAGYDPKQDITFVGAYPVDQPLFLHMWFNHPSNPGSHYFYTELQPWTPIFQKSTMYFSYYVWGSGGPWENGVKALRERNLITHK